MSYVYIPDSYINNCNVIYDGFIRSYTSSDYSTWVDIFIFQDYMEQPGSTSSPTVPICDSLNVYSTDTQYKITKPDYTDFFILILAFVFAIFLFEIRRFAKYEFA